MTRYRFQFDIQEYGYIYFDAESKEKAESLLEQVREYEIDPEQLPSYYIKHKAGETRYELLEEVE